MDIKILTAKEHILDTKNKDVMILEAAGGTMRYILGNLSCISCRNLIHNYSTSLPPLKPISTMSFELFTHSLLILPVYTSITPFKPLKQKLNLKIIIIIKNSALME